VRLLALDVGGSSIKHAIAEPDGSLTRRGSVSSSAFDDHESLIEVIGGLHDACAAEVDGIAISTCGELDPATGYMYTGGTHRFNAGTFLLDDVTARCGAPVSVENDANCALLAEAYGGGLVGGRNAVALVIGTGVGGAVMIDGRLYHGSQFHSGNASIVRVDLRDPHAADFASLNGVDGLAADYAARAGVERHTVRTHDLFDRAESGDPHAVGALTAFSGRLAVFIYNVQAILDVEAFAIGGGISARPSFVASVQAQVEALYDDSPIALPRPRVVACTRGNDANLIGAVRNFVSRFP
jgi:predicted NBD/HSP70 family sugar kinase